MASKVAYQPLPQFVDNSDEEPTEQPVVQPLDLVKAAVRAAAAYRGTFSAAQAVRINTQTAYEKVIPVIICISGYAGDYSDKFQRVIVNSIESIGNLWIATAKSKSAFSDAHKKSETLAGRVSQLLNEHKDTLDFYALRDWIKSDGQLQFEQDFSVFGAYDGKFNPEELDFTDAIMERDA